MADANTSSKSPLYEGEVFANINSFPTIYKYSPAAISSSNSPTQSSTGSNPLVVCIAGGLHLARIFYGGHRGHSPQDFLAHWLSRHGYSVLSISYPLETDPEIMPACATNFRISDWGTQAAITTRKIIDDYCSSNASVVMITWSMAGRMVVPFSIAANSLGVDVRLSISFSATPGFSSIRPLPTGMQCTGNGYFWVPPHLDDFCLQMEEMTRINGGREIVPKEVYLKEYTGKSPINLIGLQLKYDRRNKMFVRDEVGHEEDTKVLDVARFPLVAGIVPESVLDASHALGDRASWGFLLTYKLERMIGSQGLAEVKRKGKWEELKKLVKEAPERLFVRSEGNHFFFVGEVGAKAAAEKVVGLIGEAEKFQKELTELTRPLHGG